MSKAESVEQLETAEIESIHVEQTLNRHLGYVSGTLINVGQIIGTGIFSNSSLILVNCGSGAMMLVFWVIGALFSVVGIWNYLELGTMIPRSGGEQEYLAYGFPKPKQLMSFLFLMMIGVFGRGADIAQAGTVFGENIMYGISGQSHNNAWQARGFALFCITFWLMLNMISSRLAIQVNNVFTFLKIGLLLLVIAVGFAGFGHRLPEPPSLAQNFSFDGTVRNPGSYANAFYYVVYAYAGWNNLNYVMDELIDPIRTLPLCGVSSVGIVAVLYVLANMAYLAVLPLQEIRASHITVAASFFNVAFGGVFGRHVLPVLIGCSSFGSVGVVFYSGSRIMMGAARRGYLPMSGFFSQVTGGRPIRTLGLLYVISLIFLLGPPPGTVFQFIIAFTGYSTYFFCGMSVVGLLVLRRKDLERPVKVPVAVAVVFILVCCFTLVFVFVPPTQKPQYPYWLPYVCSILLGLFSIGLWYYRAYYKDCFVTVHDVYQTEVTEEVMEENKNKKVIQVEKV